jgi:hypothetical protein
MSPITRKEAQAAGLPRYFTGKPCKRGHVVERYTSSKTCCKCGNDLSNVITCKDIGKRVALNKAWLQKNPEKSKEYTRRYIAKNKGKRNLWTSNYRQAKEDRMPNWLSEIELLEMESVYEYCSALRECGLDYHVDHIVPLRGKMISGLHVPWNLQVIPGKDNVKKGNRYAV